MDIVQIYKVNIKSSSDYKNILHEKVAAKITAIIEFVMNTNCLSKFQNSLCISQIFKSVQKLSPKLFRICSVAHFFQVLYQGQNICYTSSIYQNFDRQDNRCELNLIQQSGRRVIKKQNTYLAFFERQTESTRLNLLRSWGFIKNLTNAASILPTQKKFQYATFRAIHFGIGYRLYAHPVYYNKTCMGSLLFSRNLL